MIRAYTVDPDTMLEILEDNFKWGFFAQNIGPRTPRRIAVLSSHQDWSGDIYARAYTDGRVTRQKRLEVVTTPFRHERFTVELTPATDSFDPTSAGLDDLLTDISTRRANADPSVSAVLSSARVQAQKDLLALEDMMCSRPENQDPRWACPPSLRVTRTAEGVCGALSSFLALSTELHLIDPYFSPGARDRRAMLAGLVRASAEHGRELAAFTVHCERRGKDDPTFHDECDGLEDWLPAGSAVTIRRWEDPERGTSKDENRFHNRYLLSDIGGLNFGDSITDWSCRQADDVHLLQQDAYQDRRAVYVDGKGARWVDEEPRICRGKRERISR